MIEVGRKNRIIKGLKNGDLEFTELSDELQSDKDIALVAITKNADELRELLKNKVKKENG